MQTLYHYALVLMLLAVLFNLGQALWFMMVDSGASRRSAWALTRRVGLSVALVGMVVLGVFMGWIQPHGVGG